HKLKSPINPILSETFSCHYDNIKFHSELLSTNPTVSGIYISNEDHSVNFQHINDSKFGLGKGGFNFIIKDYGLCKMTVLGDVFRIELPSISVQPTSSFIFNSTTELYPVGEMVIKCEEVEASIKFQPKSFMKSYSTKISGEIKSKGEVKYIIEGDWKNEMYIENYHTKKKNLVALGNICPISNPDYPLRTIIDESTGSDKVWEKVISLMQIKNYKEAQKLKSRLEHWQKCYVEDLKKQGQEHEAKYFEKINGNWEFKNNEI
ncbi:Oxysterol-binding protein- protein 8, partial [Clydaea vesicula]